MSGLMDAPFVDLDAESLDNLEDGEASVGFEFGNGSEMNVIEADVRHHALSSGMEEMEPDLSEGGREPMLGDDEYDNALG